MALESYLSEQRGGEGDFQRGLGDFQRALGDFQRALWRGGAQEKDPREMCNAR